MSRDVASEGVWDCIGHIFAEVVGEELADVHNRGKVFPAEPTALLAKVGERISYSMQPSLVVVVDKKYRGMVSIREEK